MSDYLFIESRSSLDTTDVAINIETACNLKQQGHNVILFLVQNGVIPARSGASNNAITQAKDAGVTVLADDFSLRERGIDNTQLAQGISPSPLETVVDALAAGTKTLWH